MKGKRLLPVESLVTSLNEQCLCESPPQHAMEEFSSHARYPFFISADYYQQMQDFIALYHQVTSSQAFRNSVRKDIPDIAKHPVASHSVFDGYDFHITPTGPKLIEVNTNAGGSYLNQSNQAVFYGCCSGYLQSPDLGDYENNILAMFRNEFALQYGGTKPLETIVILDQNPRQQFLYFEMQLFKKLFQRSGISTFIADPGELVFKNGHLWINHLPVDLIYNRHTDFYLQTPEMAMIKQAYLNNSVVLTPHPSAYGFRADKRLLTYFSDTEFLRQIGLKQDQIALLQTVIPQTIPVTDSNQELLWKTRRQWFFKPAVGFGSKAVYRGSKITQKVWDTLLNQHYVAQAFIEPSKRLIQVDKQNYLLKADLRHYVYNGKIQQTVSRLYQGQATNLRTKGGGFSPVIILDYEKLQSMQVA